MIALARSDRSVLGRWWWTVDRWTLLALAAIMGFGILLIQAATPAVAVKHGLDHDYFIDRHLIMLAVATLVIFIISLLPPRTVRWMAACGLILFLPLLIATPFIGVEIKGAVRWIHLPGRGYRRLVVRAAMRAQRLSSSQRQYAALWRDCFVSRHAARYRHDLSRIRHLARTVFLGRITADGSWHFLSRRHWLSFYRLLHISAFHLTHGPLLKP